MRTGGAAKRQRVWVKLWGVIQKHN